MLTPGHRAGRYEATSSLPPFLFYSFYWNTATPIGRLACGHLHTSMAEPGAKLLPRAPCGPQSLKHLPSGPAQEFADLCPMPRCPQ